MVNELKLSGEFECGENIPQRETDFIVVTGGPGAGKTALLEFVRKIYCHHVAILPESAGILFQGGFWRLDTSVAKCAAQRAIFHVQNEMENLVRSEMKWPVALCDRGTLDGLAYWNADESSFFQQVGTSKDKELSKYRGVLHLRSPDEEKGYNYQNPLRKETAQVARAIDDRIQNIWSHHPNYHSIDCEFHFFDKLKFAVETLFKMTDELLPSGHRSFQNENNFF